MRQRIIFPALFLIACAVSAQPKTFVLVFDEGASPERITESHWVIDTVPWEARSDALVDPDLSAVEGVLPIDYWKHAAGSVVPMTAGEQAQRDIDREAEAQADRDVQSEGSGDRICLVPTDPATVDINDSPTNRRIDVWETRGSVSARTFKHTQVNYSTDPGDVCTAKDGTISVSLYGCVDGGNTTYRGLWKLRRNGSPFNWAKSSVEQNGCGGRTVNLITNDGDCYDVVVDRDSGNGSVVTLRSQQVTWCFMMEAVDP